MFAENLRQLLLAPPLGQKNVLAIDPGFRTGCKVVCLDRQGQLKHHDVVFPHQSERLATADAAKMVELCEQVQHRSHRHRQRHGRPGDRGICQGPQVLPELSRS